jgi:hypothetical protein
MKTNIIFFILTINIIPLNNCFSQLKVGSTGKVRIGSETLWNDGSLQIIEHNKTTEARIFATSPNIARVWAMNQLLAYGFGIDASGIGRIWCDVNSPIQLISFNSSASVGINYTPGTTYKLYVGGSAYCTGVWQASDRSLKKDIQQIDGALDKLLKINGKTYHLITNEKKSCDSMERKRYGFIAQEVQEILPDLVQAVDDSSKTLAINYDGFIPLLVEALKNQQSTIQKLENEINLLKLSNITYITPKDNSGNRLFQNVPNPFNDDTQIEYFIESNTSNALINIYNLQGAQIKSYALSQKGKSKLTIKGADLNPGIYLYTLMADGKIYDTKRMLITE